MRSLLRTWGPVGVWLLLVAWNSGGFASIEHVRQLASELMQALGFSVDPAGPPSVVDGLLEAVRKPAHLVEYAVLAPLVYRALSAESLRRTQAAVAGGLAVTLIVAALDELHQHTVPSRTGTPRDVAIDLVGGGLGLLLALAVARRESRSTASAS